MTSDRVLQIQTLLLTQGALRRTYRDNRGAALEQLGLDADEAQELPCWDADGLEAQAHTLIDKRWHEVRQLLFVALTDGGDQYRRLFDEYAEQFWPEGHLRHVTDAVQFGDHLASRTHSRGWKWRVNLLRFRQRARRFRMHWVNPLPVRSRWRGGIQVLCGGTAGPRQLFVYLRL